MSFKNGNMNLDAYKVLIKLLTWFYDIRFLRYKYLASSAENLVSVSLLCFD